jgi:hypothetical protein
VRKRPAETVSERQLLLALLQSGRSVTLRDLIGWRRGGLLPPLASHGTGAGRAYYWPDPSVRQQAELVYDGLMRRGRSDSVLILVWLAGFAVPLPPLRRALLNRGRKNRSFAPPPGRQAGSNAFQTLMAGLLGPALGAAAAGPAVPVMSRGGQPTDELRRRLLEIATLYGPLLESTDLIRCSSEKQLLDAREYGRQLWQDTHLRPEYETAVHLFVVLLALLHCGQEDLLGGLKTASIINESDPDRLPRSNGQTLQIAS